MNEKDSYIQVGVTALRAPDGKFLPAVPLYIRHDQEAAESEQGVIDGIGHLMSLRMKEYLDGCRKSGVTGC